jgi:hypothetical protein
VADATPNPVTCGDGTKIVDGSCVADGSQCGPGTRFENGVCVVADPAVPVVCGPGTVEVDGQCVANCGPGTVLKDGMCVPEAGLTCGPGTNEVDGVCVPDVACGPGTVLAGNQCVPATGAWYDIRIGSGPINADGYSKVPFLALGRNADGSPATVPVVITLTRASAGTLSPAATTLGQLGTSGYLTPCNAATSTACAGTARLQLALASNPSAIVATSEEFSLVAPTGVGNNAPCLGSPNALFFDGTGYIFTGTQTVTLGTFTATAPTSTGQPAGSTSHVSAHVTPSMSSQGAWWDLDFSSEQLGMPLTTQVYNNAERWPFQPPNVPGLSVDGDGRGCNQLSGRFQIHRLVMNGTTLKEFLATFEQFCEKQPSNVLRGCVHVSL